MDLTPSYPLLSQMISLLVPVAFTALAGWLVRIYQQSARDARLHLLVPAAVKAAEQLYGSGTGALKREHVLGAISELCPWARTPLVHLLLESVVQDLPQALAPLHIAVATTGQPAPSPAAVPGAGG